MLALTEEWQCLMEVVQDRLDETLEKLESADENNFRLQQGRAYELRKMLGLQKTAEAVINAERTPKRTHSIE